MSLIFDFFFFFQTQVKSLHYPPYQAKSLIHRLQLERSQFLQNLISQNSPPLTTRSWADPVHPRKVQLQTCLRTNPGIKKVIERRTKMIKVVQYSFYKDTVYDFEKSLLYQDVFKIVNPLFLLLLQYFAQFILQPFSGLWKEQLFFFYSGRASENMLSKRIEKW